jgi:hypothetical protein
VPICCLGRDGEEEVRCYKQRFQAWEGLHVRVMRELAPRPIAELDLSLVKQCHAALLAERRCGTKMVAARDHWLQRMQPSARLNLEGYLLCEGRLQGDLREAVAGPGRHKLLQTIRAMTCPTYYAPTRPKTSPTTLSPMEYHLLFTQGGVEAGCKVSRGHDSKGAWTQHAFHSAAEFTGRLLIPTADLTVIWTEVQTQDDEHPVRYSSEPMCDATDAVR